MRTISLIVLAALLLAAVPAAADTFVVPHLLETSGRAALDRSPGTTDTFIHVFNGAVIGGGEVPPFGNQVALNIMTDLGTPYLDDGGSTICAPCVFDMGAGRSASFSLVEVMVAAGISTASLQDGFVTVETIGPSAAEMAVSADTRLYLPGGDETSDVTPLRVPCGGTGGGGATGSTRTFVFSHLIEQAGSVQLAPNTFDSQIFVAYAGPSPDVSPDPAATVDIYLFDETTGQVLLDDTGTVVCDPCSFPLGGTISPRKRKLSI